MSYDMTKRRAGSTASAAYASADAPLGREVLEDGEMPGTRCPWTRCPG
jgi:hypothetical protein